ncbi:hypothetical protein ROZALSC1DRAFT_26604 [Rozella allomycis CSF55]|uniref:Uncharacterized protein n=1 Tax=Rozella allomycis (strain CSF55) TaxID=988480 RepID=A0A075ATV0_ROZAC|nr:hypothetical protein O9G_004168 [Rozella allomycis CSF55]RKP22020.1 hypothetical protein ROZALSC1DRAFT_26604 [Rozella allomycis CSF55]|eukprot:EPZ31977.1 hypothetical protein O9G_004168 [Rozella allomycis CSF55]
MLVMIFSKLIVFVPLLSFTYAFPQNNEEIQLEEVGESTFNSVKQLLAKHNWNTPKVFNDIQRSEILSQNSKMKSANKNVKTCEQFATNTQTKSSAPSVKNDSDTGNQRILDIKRDASRKVRLPRNKKLMNQSLKQKNIPYDEGFGFNNVQVNNMKDPESTPKVIALPPQNFGDELVTSINHNTGLERIEEDLVVNESRIIKPSVQGIVPSYIEDLNENHESRRDPLHLGVSNNESADSYKKNSWAQDQIILGVSGAVITMALVTVGVKVAINRKIRKTAEKKFEPFII